MAIHKLSILVEALGTAEANRKLKGVDATVSQVGAHAGKGMRTAVGSIAKIAALGAGAALGGLALAVKQGTDALREDAVVAAQTNAVLASTRGIAGMTAQSVAGLADKLSMLNGVDDDTVQGAENLLLTFTRIHRDIFPAVTQAALDMSAALGTDANSAAMQLGKALQDPVKGVTALRRAGVVLDAQQIAQIQTLTKQGKLYEAQSIILREVQTEFAGVARAQADADPSRRLGVAWEKFTKVLATAVLPVVNEVQRTLTDVLADPALLSGARELGSVLGDAAHRGIEFARSLDWAGMARSLRSAAGFAGDLVKAFLGLPDWVKTAVVTGWGLNKLSGGALTSILGDVTKGVLKQALGINAAVVNVRGGVVNGGGGGGLPGGAAGAGLLAPGLLTAAIGIAAPVVLSQAMQEWAKGQKGYEPNTVSVTGSRGQSLGTVGGSYGGMFGALGPMGNALSASGAASYTGPGDAPTVDLSKATRDRGFEVDNAIRQSWSSAAARIVRPLDALHRDFLEQIGVLRKSADPSALAKAASRAAADVLRGVGSAKGTESLLATLRKDRKAVAASGDSAALAKIDAAIRAVESKLPGRQLAASQLAAARKIAGSGESTKQKLADLSRSEAGLRRDGMTTAARQVAAIRATTAAVKAQRPPTISVLVNGTWVQTAAGVTKTVATSARWGSPGGRWAGKKIPIG